MVFFFCLIILKLNLIFTTLILFSSGVGRLAIHTDSDYLINSLTNWIYTWLANGWQKSDGSPLKHKKQYRDLLLAMENMDIEWVSPSYVYRVFYYSYFILTVSSFFPQVHVKGHSQVEGNEMADKMAREGASYF